MSTPFIGADFRLEGVEAIGLATLRVRFTQDPLIIDESGVNDALNPDNYTLNGPAYNYVISTSAVFDDPQAVDLYLAAPLDLGSWTLVGDPDIQSENSDPLEEPKSLTLTVDRTATQSPISGGAVNDDVQNVLRKHFNPALKGDVWNDVLRALAAGDVTNWNNAALAKLQLTVATASGKYLERRASDYGYKKPNDLAMPDDLFRRLVTISRTSKLTQEAVLEVLEVFYGPDTVRATSVTAESQPWVLQDGDDLRLLLDETDVVTCTFKRNEFARIGQASALEVAASITRDLRTARTQAYAIAFTDETTGEEKVKIYSGRLGLSSSIRVIGGSAQVQLQFPELIFEDTGPSPATWEIEYSPTNPGNLRFTETTGVYDLNLLRDDDIVLIYGPEFEPSLNQGTFTISNVEVFYSGPTLIQRFEVTNPEGQEVASLPQLTFKALFFYRPSKRSLHSQERRVIVSQTGPESRITVPATTQAVTRTSKTAAYAVLNEELIPNSVSRDQNGVVTVEFDDPHGLLEGDVIVVSGFRSGVPTLPTITTGSPGVSDSSQATTWSEIGTYSRIYQKGTTLEEGGFLVIGGQTQTDPNTVVSKVPSIFEVTSVTENLDGSRTVNYTVTGLVHVPTTGAQNFGLARIGDEIFITGGHSGRVATASNAMDKFTFRRSPAIDLYSSTTMPFNVAGHGITAIPTGFLWTSGGFSSWNIAEKNTRRYSTGTGWVTFNPMREARLNHDLVSVSSAGGVLAIGGRRPFSRLFDDSDTNYYNFDADGDDSIGGLHFALGGSPVTAIGQAGNCITPSGTTITSAGADQTALNAQLLGEYTIEGWMTKAAGTVLSIGGTGATDATQNLLFSFGIDGSDKFFIRYQRAVNVSVATASTATATSVMPYPHSVSAPAFYHFSITKTNSGSNSTFTIYVNSVVIHTFTGLSPSGGSAALMQVGADTTGVHAAFAGYVDELRISDVARAASDITRHYNEQFGMVYWDVPVKAYRDALHIGKCLETCELLQLDNTWKYTGAMGYARYGSGIATLPDGRVLVAGGIGYKASGQVTPAPLSSCELYDPQTGQWMSISDMSVAREFATATYVPSLNGVVVTGGEGVTSYEILDLATLTWKLGVSSLATGLYRTVGGLLDDEFVITTGGAVQNGGGFYNTTAKNYLMVPEGEVIYDGGINRMAKITSIPSSTSLTYDTSDSFVNYTSGDVSDVTVLPVKAEAQSIPGPYVFDPQHGFGITGTTGTVDVRLEKNHQYQILELTTTPVTDETPALAFPDEPGYLVFNFGNPDTEVGPVEYLGRISDSELKLSYEFRFPIEVPEGSTVRLLTGREPYIPSPTILSGALYATASAAGRLAALKAVDDTLGAGLESIKTVVYPGDYGLGAAGFPDESNYKLSDRVAAWGSDNSEDIQKLKDKE